jgi:hypothetical protein
VQTQQGQIKTKDDAIGALTREKQDGKTRYESGCTEFESTTYVSENGKSNPAIGALTREKEELQNLATKESSVGTQRNEIETRLTQWWGGYGAEHCNIKGRYWGVKNGKYYTSTGTGDFEATIAVRTNILQHFASKFSGFGRKVLRNRKRTARQWRGKRIHHKHEREAAAGASKGNRSWANSESVANSVESRNKKPSGTIDIKRKSNPTRKSWKKWVKEYKAGKFRETEKGGWERTRGSYTSPTHGRADGRGGRRETKKVIARGEGYTYIAALWSPDLRHTTNEKETPLLLW